MPSVKEKVVNSPESNTFDNHIDSEIDRTLDMAERPDLLISLEQIMLRNFPKLVTSDTLASAFSIIVLQNLEELVVLDERGIFSGIIKAEKLYKKMPPNILDIPFQLRDQGEKTSRSILEIGRKKVREELALDKPDRLFQTTEPLSNLLSELNSLYTFHLKPRIVPVFDQNADIQGVITYQEVLNYLKQDSILQKTTVGDLLSSECLKEYVPILTPDDTLATAEILMEYTLTDYILICDEDNNIISYLDKIQISKITHYNLLKLISCPLGSLAKPLDKALEFVTPEISLSQVVNYLMEGKTMVLIASDYPKQVPVRGLISPLTIVSFFLSSF